MAESAAVASGDLATAAQYNNLRNDVLSTTLGHVHDGTNGRSTFAGLPLAAQNTTDAASNQVGKFGGGNRATPADNDEGYLSFELDDNAGAQTEFVRFTWKALDVTNTSKDSRPELQYYTADTLRELAFPAITADDTVAVLALAQTLTNKTLTAPTLTAPALDGHISFPATQSASAGANDLDDYEEGTFTPAIADVASGDGTSKSQVYATQVGRYTKIGNRVFYSIRVKITDLGTMTTSNSAFIVGLPFTTNSTIGSNGVASFGFCASLALPNASESLTGFPTTNGTYMDLYTWDATGGPTALLISELSVDADMMLTGFFEV